MIEVSSLRKVFQAGKHEIVALDDVSLSVREGEIYGVIGESGAGKSTLIRCVNALERPTSGTVIVDGQDITRLGTGDLRRARQNMGMIFQGFNLLSSRTAAGNIALPLEIMGMPASQRRTRVAEMLHLVGLEDRANAYPARLSGGQKQRVGIARALAGSPRVLLSDESTSALDPGTTATILDLLKSLNRQLNITILLITHEMEVVKRICDQVAVLEGGNIVEQGRVTDLASNPESRIARSFFPQFTHESRMAGAIRVVVPVGADADLTHGVRTNVVGGSLEHVGDTRQGQFTLDLQQGRMGEAIGWLQASHPGATVL
jgi:D-methionine transport system ATP-binding protein